MCTRWDLQWTRNATPCADPGAINWSLPVVVVGTQISMLKRLCCYLCVREQARRVAGLGCENLRNNDVARRGRLFQGGRDALGQQLLQSSALGLQHR